MLPSDAAARARFDEGDAQELGTNVVQSPISLVLIDDNRLLREGIAAMIHTQPGFRVLAASADVDEALQKVRDAKPDVVPLDFGLEDHDSCLLYTSDAADERSSVDLGG